MWWLLVVAMVVLFISFFRKSKIPKIIWSYWNDENIPEITKKCISTWRKHNPDYDIRVLTPKTASELIGDMKFKHNDSPQRESDYVRLMVLSKYGGVWCDASIIMIKPLPKKNCEFFGYYLEKFTSNKKFPVIESWFFMCEKGSTFVGMWRDEFLRLNSFDTIKDYVNDVESNGVDLQKISQKEYLSIHVSSQYVQQKLGPVNLCLEKAEDGPLQLVDDPSRLLKICKGTNTPFIKLRGGERRMVEENWEKYSCLFSL